VADAGIIVLTGKSGIAVGTEKAWKSMKDANKPTMFYVSKMDEDHANYFKVVEDLRAQFGNSVVPLVFPMMKGEKCVGLVDLLSKTAKDTQGNPCALTPEAEDHCEEFLMELSEQVAETDEALMEKFFMEEPFTMEELVKGVKDGMMQRSITPVFAGSATAGYGSKMLMEYIVKFCPNPLEGLALATEEDGEMKLDPAGSPMAFVYKTTADQFGKNSFFKVSGIGRNLAFAPFVLGSALDILLKNRTAFTAVDHKSLIGMAWEALNVAIVPIVSQCRELFNNLVSAIANVKLCSFIFVRGLKSYYTLAHYVIDNRGCFFTIFAG
jgi:hypothetical protein